MNLKFCKIFITVVVSIISLVLTAIFVLLVFKKISNEYVPCVCLICVTALLGLSFASLGIIFCGNEVDKFRILSTDFNKVSDKIIPCPKKKSNEKNPKGTSGGEDNDDKLGETADCYRQLETLEKCFKAYANAIADI